MNIFYKQFRHSVVFVLLLVLLLSIALAFCSIGISTWVMVQEQIRQMKSNYTTIAVPKGNSVPVGPDIVEEKRLGDLLLTEDGWLSLEEQEEYHYPGLLAEDKRGFLAAHVSGCESLSYYEHSGFDDYNWFDAYNNSMMVAAVKCIEVSEYEENTNYDSLKSYRAEFSLEDSVCRLPVYDTFPQDGRMAVFSQLYTVDGQIPFEEGKTYLLFGMEQMMTMRVDGEIPVEIEDENYMVSNQILLETVGIDDIYRSGTTGNYDWLKGNLFFSWQKKTDADGKGYLTLTEDSLPFCTEYTGDWRAFLNSEEGTVWREEIIPWCQLNHESASVILTDNVDSMLLFNNGIADILEGRKFEKEEYTEGKQVCLVSGAYAEKNHLSVGDILQLDLYQSELHYQAKLPAGAWGLEDGLEPIWVQEPCREENRIGEQMEYTIVGIYTAPEFSTGWHSFQADTIFVPKASVPDAEKYEQWTGFSDNIMMYSVILESGMEEKFEKYLADRGYGDIFVYSDQGYHEAAKSFEALSANAMRLALAGLAVFVLAGVLFLFLNFRRVSPIIRNMRLLGIRANVIWKELLEVLAVLIGISAIAGAGLGYALYGTVTAQVLEKEIAVSPWMMILCAAALAVVMLIAAAVTASVQAGKRLMSKRKKK